jgi:SET domain-containing protein
VDATGLPRIVFMATRDIAAQEELLFDYGDRDHHAEFPWLST